MSTSIEWTDETWNPTTGCSKVSQGCKNCYAERLFPKVYPGRAFTDVRCHPDRLEAPLHWKKPRMVFVNSMSDLFHEAVPFEFIVKVWDVCALASQHTFQILTKRPQRMIEFAQWMAGRDHISIAEWPRNVWLGVSVEDQATADARIPLLLQTPAAIRFVSYEPALGPIDMRRIDYRWQLRDLHEEFERRYGASPELAKANALGAVPTGDLGANTPYLDVLNAEWFDGWDMGRDGQKLDWVICGGESGPKARPMRNEWARSVRDQCQAAGVAFFFKQWGAWLPAGCDGNPDNPKGQVLNASDEPVKIGKHAAGRLLDTREWNEYPERPA